MQTSQDHCHQTCSSGTSAFLYNIPAADPYCFFDANTTHLSFTNTSQSNYNDPSVFTLESTPAPALTKLVLKHSTHSPQCSLSYISDPSPDPYNYGTPTSCFSTTEDDNYQLYTHKLKELESFLYDDTHTNHVLDTSNFYSNRQATPVVPPGLDLTDVLVRCATALSDNKMKTTAALMEVLGTMVSVSGDPIQRLGAYLLEGLRARVERSGTLIYKSLKCEEPTGAELLSYMHVLYQICPFWKFAYTSANVVISQAMQNESRIHIIDFQIAQGSQWAALIQDLARRPGGPPHICITGVDDSQSTHARGGGLHIVGDRLSQLAKSCNVPFEFHDAAAMLDSEVKLDNLRIKAGEVIAVNFPFILHHVPDESIGDGRSKRNTKRI